MNFSARLAALGLLLAALIPRPVTAQWTVNGVPVCTAASNQFGAKIARDGAGGAIVTWYDYRDGEPDIYARRVLLSGVLDSAWPANGRALCTASRGQQFPCIVADGSGGATIGWHDFRAGSSADIFVQHVLASGAVDPTWPDNGRAVCTAADDQLNPTAVEDGAGGVIVAWLDNRGGPDTDIYAQRILYNGVVDPAWPLDGRAVCTAAENQSAPAVASDGIGGAIVAWSDLRNGSHSDIYAQRVLSSGVPDPAWPINGRELCGVAWNQSEAVVVDDGAGGAIVAWSDYRSGIDADIYAHHVLASGVPDPAWPADGIAVSTAPGEQYTPVIVGDGAQGAIVAWYDYRGGAEADVYANRVLASGVVDPTWPDDGRALCLAAGDQLSPTIVSDGTGGAIVAWYDYREGSADVFAQRVLASGVVDPAWPDSGRALCTAPGEQYTPAIDSDGSGGAIVAWSDFRPGTYSDIYAQRVVAGGGLIGVDPILHRRLGLQAPQPNPAHGDVVIHLTIPESRRVTVEVFEATGRRVRTLVAAEMLPTGARAVTWDGADDLGVAQRSGIYLIRIRADEASEMGDVGAKVVLLR